MARCRRSETRRSARCIDSTRWLLRLANAARFAPRRRANESSTVRPRARNRRPWFGGSTRWRRRSHRPRRLVPRATRGGAVFGGARSRLVGHDHTLFERLLLPLDGRTLCRRLNLILIRRLILGLILRLVRLLCRSCNDGRRSRPVSREGLRALGGPWRGRRRRWRRSAGSRDPFSRCLLSAGQELRSGPRNPDAPRAPSGRPPASAVRHALVSEERRHSRAAQLCGRPRRTRKLAAASQADGADSTSAFACCLLRLSITVVRGA